MQKTVIFSVLLVLMGWGARAQYGFMPAHMYVYNPTWINPAFTGYQQDHRISLYGSKDLVNNDNAPPGAYTARMMYEGYLPALSSGLGLQVVYDSHQILSTLQTSLLYSYHYQINDQQQILLGTQLAFNKTYVNYGNYALLPPGDPLYQPEGRINDNLDADIGLVYQHTKLEAGLSVKNVLASPYYLGSQDLRNIRSFSGYFSYHTAEQGEFSFHPSAALTRAGHYVFGDFNMVMDIQRTVFLGATFSAIYSQFPVFASAKATSYWKLHGGGTLLDTLDLLLLYLPYSQLYRAEQIELMVKVRLNRQG